MAGIPVHTASPINPHGANGVPPSTTGSGYAPLVNVPQTTPASVPATTTTVSSQLPTPVQPGAAAMPAPTQSLFASYTPTRTAPPPPSQTSGGPPPPQPGAVPSPLGVFNNRKPTTSPLPEAGEVPQPFSFHAPQPTPTSTHNFPAPLPPHQQQPNLSTPNRAQPPANITSHDLSHPPGYMQDTHASFDERALDPYRPFNSTTSSHTRTRSGGGILDSSPGNQGMEEEKGIWDTAKSWAKTAGEKLSQGEQEVWKAINGEK